MEVGQLIFNFSDIPQKKGATKHPNNNFIMLNAWNSSETFLEIELKNLW